MDKLVDKIRAEKYLTEILKLTQDDKYVTITYKIIKFIRDVYRYIEPSHFNGQIVVFVDFSMSNSILDEGEEFYDKAILSNSYNSLIFQIKEQENELPLIWKNVEHNKINNLLKINNNFIAYVFNNKQEYFVVNNSTIDIPNKFSCPSIFALQYHYLNEALLDYKKERIRNTSCEHFRKCFADTNWIYFKNKPENCLQVSLKEFLQTIIRGANVIREYNLGASKPVDVRVFWREANRSALIEVKWIGQSLKEDNSIGTKYSNSRANEGMKQIKEYIDLNSSDSPTIISKGYLMVIDGRRKKIGLNKVDNITRANGFHYENKELEINDDKKYWEKFPNIEKPIRMFVEPICEI